MNISNVLVIVFIRTYKQTREHTHKHTWAQKQTHTS